MMWLAVDKDGTEKAFVKEPWRCAYSYWDCYEEYCDGWEDHTIVLYSELPKGTIKKLIGKQLVWEDEAVELKEGLK